MTIPEALREKSGSALRILVTEQRVRTLARRLRTALNERERAAIVAWLLELDRIRGSDAPARTRMREALRATTREPLVRAVLTASGRQLVELAWEDRSWAQRLAGLGILTTTVLLDGRRAGIAALGSAVGVPLWVVFGGGGALVGVFLDELEALVPVRAAAGPRRSRASIGRLICTNPRYGQRLTSP